ncbi:hypothetical protein PTSG_11316 [Salpingoeca rosetta]|uniref:Peptidase S54 rhomboid domain-containing protein n=1 Tax=Salpingoeca rosetta (strain ATCC 50818 / BSB-021) TaxID=946362 RepID=F2UT20_SALR5|nr:uncharacterized protein PTSG_11316 [Salpingoeca rosetta]EGD81279.1 hypothetical protein PTSG_11316 [Salpingoeca rosetta]|eukprot:XP_004987675.1 hypothetical protein PTSG_11316 [Salpingoeca rosetta]
MDKERLAEVLRGLRSNRGSLSWFTKGVIAALLVMHLITYIPGGYNAMALAPGEVGPPSLHIWTFVTAPFTEKALIQVLLDIVAVFVCASMLEPLWGGFKLLEMIVVVGAAANLVTTLSYIALYAASSNPDLLFLPFSGFSAVVCGLAVAYKQSFPQATVQLGLLRVHTRHLPLALIAAHVAFYLLGTGSLAQVILSASGFLTAWVFLRFYQNRNGVKGDPSDAFGFESFFPSAVQ